VAAGPGSPGTLCRTSGSLPKDSAEVFGSDGYLVEPAALNPNQINHFQNSQRNGGLALQLPFPKALCST